MRPLGFDGRESTNYLYNNVAPQFGMNIAWESVSNVDETRREYWTAVLYVNGMPVSDGRGYRLGHAKDEAAYRFLVAGGFIIPNPY